MSEENKENKPKDEAPPKEEKPKRLTVLQDAEDIILSDD